MKRATIIIERGPDSLGRCSCTIERSDTLFRVYATGYLLSECVERLERLGYEVTINEEEAADVSILLDETEEAAR